MGTDIQAEIEALKEFGAMGIVLIIVLQLLRMLYGVIKDRQNKPDEKTIQQENQYRNESRDKIMATYEIIRDVQERQKNRDKSFFEMMGKVEDMEKIITAIENGTPLVYQPKLDIQMRELINEVKDLKRDRN